MKQIIYNYSSAGAEYQRPWNESSVLSIWMNRFNEVQTRVLKPSPKLSSPPAFCTIMK